ncbi:Asp23/Gls24 family envelope stress response protein [Amycolatopsis jejuensis]|uniref:Asp23/Gls24 family envelope stress response protein n=1 Tax=Amycolatopsis jejuensis TaxID=330084 RepID=UPI000A0564BF
MDLAAACARRPAAVGRQRAVDYGVSIVDLARSARRHVIGAIEQMTGLKAVEVNILVSDVRLPGDHTEDDDTGPCAVVLDAETDAAAGHLRGLAGTSCLLMLLPGARRRRCCRGIAGCHNRNCLRR